MLATLALWHDTKTFLLLLQLVPSSISVITHLAQCDIGFTDS